MMSLVSNLWPGLAGALVLGLAAGGLTGFPRGRGPVAAAAVVGAATLALAALALLQRVPGRAGLWVETAALMLAAYLGGCFIGALARRARGSGPSAGP